LLREGLAAIPGVRLLGQAAAAPASEARAPEAPAPEVETLPVATFTVAGVPHALVAARLAAEEAIGVRHGCFCAHPYLMRLLGLTRPEVRRYRDQVLCGDRSAMPGAVRASAGLNTTDGDIARLLDAVARIARGGPPPVPYRQDRRTGDFHPGAGSASGHAPTGLIHVAHRS